MFKVAVIGLGKYGSAVAVGLAQQGVEVLAVDKNASRFQAVADDVSAAVGFDATDLTHLKAYDIGGMDVVVVAIGTNFSASVMVTMHCKELGVKQIVAKALDSMQEAVLTKVGADLVIKPEEDMGARLAKHLVTGSVMDFIDLMEGYVLRRVVVPEAWDGQSLAELNLLGNNRLNLLQVHRQGDEAETIALPDGRVRLFSGDTVDVIGPIRDLDKLD